MNENKNIEASPPLSSLLRASSGVLNASDDSISQDTENVNRKFSDRDSSYLNAVNREDMETAQRMVDEAAKKAGYTVKVYHGTQSFGFTKLNVKNSDDGISFFATDAEETASTYAHGMSTRSINAKIKTATPKNLTASKEAILGHINDIKNEYTQLLGAGWLNFNEDFFEEDTHRYSTPIWAGLSRETSFSSIRRRSTSSMPRSGSFTISVRRLRSFPAKKTKFNKTQTFLKNFKNITKI